ncbi:MAG: hypothetical protein HY611_01350 [Elusimicrobia bacterium]|nr:hypothetical protein [Elusimicrobiota bacterium]
MLFLVEAAPALGAAEQMALDEVLLGLPSGDAFLRFYRWKSPAMTFGYFQSYGDVLPLARAAGVPDGQIVRRSSGGGAVAHGRDLTFSIVTSWADFGRPKELYRRLHAAVREGLRSRRLEVGLYSGAGGEGRIGCFQKPVELDLTAADGRKVLGGALRKSGGRVLYQGSLQAEMLDQSGEGLTSAVLAGLGKLWDPGGFRPLRLSEGELEKARSLADVKYATRQWNEKR